MEFRELLHIRQATRKFEDRPVEKEKIQELLERIRLAPSACNSQPWHIFVAKDSAHCKAVAEGLQEPGVNAFLSNVPLFLVIGERDAVLKPGAAERFGSRHFIPYDIGILTAYIALAASDLGLHNCIIGWANQEKLRAAVHAPEGMNLPLAVAIGYPAPEVTIRPKIREPLEKTVTIL